MALLITEFTWASKFETDSPICVTCDIANCKRRNLPGVALLMLLATERTIDTTADCNFWYLLIRVAKLIDAHGVDAILSSYN
jgi:hypothetical protein